MYQVISVTGNNKPWQGGIFAAEFEEWSDAKDYRDKNNAVGNLHIKMPDGSWWPADYNTGEENE